MKDFILNFLLRAVLGVLAIYAFNTLFSGLGIAFYIGINLLNLFIIGLLGISGFALVFSVAVFSVL